MRIKHITSSVELNVIGNTEAWAQSKAGILKSPHVIGKFTEHLKIVKELTSLEHRVD